MGAERAAGARREARVPSFRLQLVLLMLLPMVVTTGLLGWMAYRSASAGLIRDAVRAVGIEADAREQVLIMRLARQHERAQSLLELARTSCLDAPRPAECLRPLLADFMATEGALAAHLSVGGLGALRLGPEAERLDNLEPLAPGQLARYDAAEANGAPGQRYDIVVLYRGMTLVLRFSDTLIEEMFGERHRLGTSGETFLADAHGVFLTAPKYPGHSGESHSHPIDARPMLTCLSGRDGEMLAPDYRNVPVIHAFRFIEEIGGGCIMAHIAQEEAFAPARALGTRMLLAGLGLVLGAVALCLLFARRLTHPVWRLTERARALQAGDFDAAVPVEGPRELRTFAETFAAMARSLRASTRELEWERARLDVLATLSRLLAESSLDPRAVMDATCRHLAERMGDVCTLRLLPPEGQRMEAVVAHAPDVDVDVRTLEELRAQAQRPAEGPVARVLATGEPLFLPTFSREELERTGTSLPQESRDSVSQVPVHSVALLPLKMSGRVLGVLELMRLRPEAPYSPEDFTLFQEVADRVALAVENARLYQQAREAVRVREDVVAIVSHDLRTPLNAISLSAHTLLKREPLPDWQAKGLSRISSAAGRANRMIHDLLDFTQARVGGIPVSPAPCELHTLARHVVDEVRLAHPGRHIELEVEGDTQGEWDCDRMAQVLTNLVGNAVQHSPPEEPVRVSLREEQGLVVLEVHNGGTPIPADVLPTIFEPFRRGQEAEPRAGSVGLGLYITREVVQAHGGTLSARSAEGQGTTFTVSLPRRPPPVRV